MKKLTSFIHESNKQDFSKKILIKLDNNVVLEAHISVKDLNESFANSQILESLVNKTIKNVDFITEKIEELSDPTIIDNAIDSSEIFEYYIPWTSVFDTPPYYQAEKIASAISDDEDVIATYTEEQYGWSNQPEVVVVKIQSDNIKVTIERLTEKLKSVLGTQWVRMDKKDW